MGHNYQKKLLLFLIVLNKKHSNGMKTSTFFLLLIMAAQSLHAQVTHTVQENGFAYSPATLTITAGESVKFEGTASHPIQEVSETAWSNNMTLPLEGGFAFSDGSGTVAFSEPGTYYYVCTAHVASQGMKGKIIVLAPTALDETSSANEYDVYPLPLTGNELFVKSHSEPLQQVSVEIYDLTGNLRIASTEVQSDFNMRIDCSTLPKGMFLVKLKVDGEDYVSKVLRL